MSKKTIIYTDRRKGKISIWVMMPDECEQNIGVLEEEELTPAVRDVITNALKVGHKLAKQQFEQATRGEWKRF